MTETELAGAKAPAAGPTKKGRKRKKPAPPLEGPARIPVAQETTGYYKDPVTGERLRRVTTILNAGLPKGSGLMYWHGKVVAETAMERLPQLVAASMDPQQQADMLAWLTRTPERARDERGDVGRAVHRLIEARVLGEPVPQELLDDVTLRPFLRHFEAWVKEWEIEFEASEMVVANRKAGYAGTLDFLCRSRVISLRLGLPPKTVYPGDTKTGGELDVKGVYPEAGYQMAAYRSARVGWLRDGTKVPMPSTSETGIVLHLRPEGYRVIPVDAGPSVFREFEAIHRVARGQWTTAKKIVGSALSLPDQDEIEMGEAA
ncbi:hypothetical protein [Streptomyces xiamenensis]|uniref:hypothetical protein n=1 Tax=Streptomyces xiamenensis TaxID=408015 RepID=UPI003D731CBC